MGADSISYIRNIENELCWENPALQFDVYQFGIAIYLKDNIAGLKSVRGSPDSTDDVVHIAL